MESEIELTEKEIFELVRERFLEFSQLDDDIIEVSIRFNNELHEVSVNELFRQFTIWTWTKGGNINGVRNMSRR